MTATPFFYALYLFCGLGSAALAAGVRSRAALLLGALAFAFFTVVLGDRVPEPMWVAGLSAAVALVVLLRPRYAFILPVLAGALAGVFASALRAQGLPSIIALIAAILIPSLAGYFAFRNPQFAPPSLQEEALLVIFVLGAVTAVAPQITQGWTSAVALNLTDNKSTVPAIPGWVWALEGGSIILGGVFAVWRRS